MAEKQFVQFKCDGVGCKEEFTVPVGAKGLAPDQKTMDKLLRWVKIMYQAQEFGFCQISCLRSKAMILKDPPTTEQEKPNLEELQKSAGRIVSLT